MKKRSRLSRNDAFAVGERSRPGCSSARPRAEHRCNRTRQIVSRLRVSSGLRGRGPLRPRRARSPRPSVSFRLRRSDGFTLIEIMVVVIILGVLAATIIPQFIGTTHDAKVSTAKSNIAELESALARFYVHLDRYPTLEEGLKVLVDPPTGDDKKWRGPYINLLRPDPWGNPYQYRYPGTRRSTGFDIWSRGADGADGGEGEGADIGNW